MDFVSTLITPLGLLSIRSDGNEINAIGYENADPEENPCTLTEDARQQMQEYFEGKRTSFDFPVAQQGTEFQQKVWTELLNIRAGEPISYLKLSKNMNNPLAIRAIAAANGKNKLMIVVPCHRVIGSRGDLVGYAGELWRKKWLLEHEAKMMNSGQAVMVF